MKVSIFLFVLYITLYKDISKMVESKTTKSPKGNDKVKDFEIIKNDKDQSHVMDHKLMKTRELKIKIKKWFKNDKRTFGLKKQNNLDGDYYSQVQIWANNYCNMKSNLMSNSARFKIEQESINGVCIENIDLDYSMYEPGCISNCGTIVRCRGAARTYVNKFVIDPNHITTQIEKNCKISQMQESLDSLCNKGYVSRIDKNYNVKCYSIANLNYKQYGSCLDDCRNIINCKGSPKNVNNGVLLDQESIKWNSLTNGCPCNDDNDGTNVNYMGCQDIAQDNSKCLDWISSMSPSNSLYSKRIIYPNNHCRKTGKGASLHCMIEMDKLMACAPKEIQKITIQSGTIFDIWITPYIPKYRFKLIFIEDFDMCGDTVTNFTQNIIGSYEHEVFNLTKDIGLMNDNNYLFEYSDESLNEQSYVFKGYLSLDMISSKSKICACMYSTYYETVNGIENPCDESSDYKITIGKLEVEHNVMPKVVEKGYNEIQIVNDFGIQGMVALVNEVDSLVCKKNEFIVSDICLKSVDILMDVEKTDRTQNIYMPEMNRRPVSKYTKQIIWRDLIGIKEPIKLVVDKAGDYSLINQQSMLSDGLTSIRYRIRLHGYYSKKNFTLISSQDGEIGYREQSIFFDSWRVHNPPIAIVISKYDGIGKLCNKPFAYSTRIFPVIDSEIDKTSTRWRSSDFDLTNRISELKNKVQRFEVCAFTWDSEIHSLGYGVFTDFVNHELTEIIPNPNLKSPKDVFNYKIYDEWDVIRILMYIDDDKTFEYSNSKINISKNKKNYVDFVNYLNNSNFQGEFINIDSNTNGNKDGNNYPAILSFWSYPDENLVRIWIIRPSRLSPTYIGQISVKSPISFGVYLSMNKLMAVVLSEGDFAIKIYEIEIVKGHYRKNEFNLRLVKTSSNENSNEFGKLVSPIDMKLINYYDNCIGRHLIIVSDVGLNCVILYDSSLMELNRLCRDNGIDEIFEPTNISCTDSKYDMGQCINTFGGFKYETEENSTYVDCFITQTHENNILWVRVDLIQQDLILMSSYSGGNVRENGENGLKHNTKLTNPCLINPISVEAVSYHNTILIYVVESENPSVSLLTLDLNNSLNKISYYSNTELRTIPYGNFVHVSKLLMSTHNGDLHDDQDYIMLFRIGARNKQNDNQGLESINIINIKDTISINNFEYTVPEWIVMGEEVNIRPRIDLINKQNLLRYELEILDDELIDSPDKHRSFDKTNLANASVNRKYDWNGNASYKNIIKIDNKTGEITILINYIHKLKLSISVTAFGFIESKTIYLTFQVSCKDGYYYNGDDLDLKTDSSNGCSICPLGKYNSLNIIKRDLRNWKMCNECPDKETTISTGATSITQCLCAPGYEPTQNINNRCEPCKPGTWKSSVGMQKCTGNGCYKNSFSDKIGSTSEDDRDCSCNKGYYYLDNTGTVKECVPCEIGYFCPGGIYGKKIMCPTNTTTQISIDSNGVFRNLPISINECFCKKGYEIVSQDKLLDLNSPEYKLKERIEDEIKFMKIDTSMVDIKQFLCKPCGYRKYKDSVSNTKCNDCPVNSFSESISPTKIEECNKCDPGYYEEEIELNICEICNDNHICVGSNPMNESNKVYAKKKIMCPENSKTVGPNEMNNSILNCLCIEGYVPVITGSLLKCIPAPKNHYKDIVGNVEAIPCPYGSLTISNGATSKEQCVCDKGTYFDLTTQNCTICPTGKYCLGGKDENMKDRQPMDCGDVNALTKSPGASSISECACKAGYYMDIDSQNKCRECPENHYKSYVSNDMCTRCDENSSTSGKKGATSKEQCVCDPGYYFDNACISCNFNNKYCPGGVIEVNDDNGLTKIVTQSPITCPPNTEIAPGVDNASSISFCKCTKGYSFVSENLDINNKICDPCVPGTYKSSIMDSSCNGLCTQNATSLEGAVSSNQCFCRSGYFYLEGGICSKCMEGAICDGGLIDNDKLTNNSRFVVDIDDHTKPVAMEGYYLDKINTKLRKPDDWKFIKCPINNSCLGDDKCSNSMEHYLCSECKKGYTNNFVKGVLCQQCPKIIPNITITIVYYLVLLLINIVMACLNISAGFNRRSIHSVVIKIALNYAICTSVVNVINFSELKLPEGLRKITSSWTKIFDSEDVVYYTSIDCILRQLFNLEHSESFFYAMLYMAFLPVILLLVVTLLMLIILSLFKMKRYNDTRTKLALLHESEIKGMEKIADGLREQYENERLLMIFRYIPLPGQTGWVKFINFLEDMIPIYVTVLFSVHGKITSRMLSLLDCTYIDLGRSFPGKYMLGPAMSIKCSLSHSDGYLKYLILGLSGLIIWGFGIPFLSFIVLYINRKNLYAPSIRMKYGFLHNGYRQDYWFWETIVFTRKCLVLVIGSIVIVPSQNYSGSRIWMALVVAVIFLILQLIYKPFDERDYFVLGRLENHSMIAWTFTLILFSFIIEANFSSWYNITLIFIILTLNFVFIFEVLYQLFIAYSHNLRLQNKEFNSSFYTIIYHFLTKFSTNLKSTEPVIFFDPITCTTNLRSCRKCQNKLDENISYYEKEYFAYIMTEIICFAHSRMQLDVIPLDFPEYITRLTFAVHYDETCKQRTNTIVKSFADGNIYELVNLSMINKNYMNNRHKFMNKKRKAVDESNTIVNPELMFNKDVLYTGIPLSDFYVSLSIIKLKDFKSIANSFMNFRELKKKEKILNIQNESRKLNDLYEITKKIDNEPNIIENVEMLFSSQEDIDNLNREIKDIEEKIRMFKTDPLNALKLYNSEEYSDLEVGDFETDMLNFGFTKRDKNK